MSRNPLKVVSVENKMSPSSLKPKTHRQEISEQFDKMWKDHPAQFDPRRNCMERERINRIMQMINRHLSLEGKTVVDLGCGYGQLSLWLKDCGAQVHAVDIAEEALAHLKKENKDISLIQDCLPSTRLEEEGYDLVVCTDLIAYIQERDRRLLLNEFTRLVKKDGFVVCSTAIDIDSLDALERFYSLCETELNIIDFIISYHRGYIKLRDFFEAPARFSKASRDPICRQEGMNKRHSVSQWWFHLNTNPLMGKVWSGIQTMTNPVVRSINQNHKLLLLLEKISKQLWGEEGISHIIIIGKRRPLVETKATEPPVYEIKQKKTVWE